MTHNERLEGLDRYDLTNLVEMANAKLKELADKEKSLYYVVSDENMNLGFFRMDNLDGAINLLVECARKGYLKLHRDTLQINVQRWYDHEIDDLIVEKE